MGILLCGCCFTCLSAKANEIILIVAYIISEILLVMCLYIVKWLEIHIINLIMFIVMVVIILICLIFIIILRVWRSKNLIKTLKRSQGIKITTASSILSVICLIVCIFEEIVLMIYLNKKRVVDNTNDDYYFYRRILYGNNPSSQTISNSKRDNSIDKEYYISYLTLSYMEFMLILSICIIYILKKRIINKSDYDVPYPSIGQQVVVGGPIDQYGRHIIVMQPGQVIDMQNGGNYYSQNLNFGQRNYYPNSNQYVVAQPVQVNRNNNRQIQNNINDKGINSSNRNIY